MSDNEEMKRVAKKLKSCQDSGSRDEYVLFLVLSIFSCAPFSIEILTND